LAAEVKDLEGSGPVQDGPSKKLAAAQHDIEELEEEHQIEKCRSAKLERRLNEFRLEPETTDQTDITQLWLEKDILLHEVKTSRHRRVAWNLI